MDQIISMRWIRGSLLAATVVGVRNANDFVPNNRVVIASNAQEATFRGWTGMSQKGLLSQWEKERQKRARGEKAGTTTTCNAFLNVLVNGSRATGGLKTAVPFDSWRRNLASGGVSIDDSITWVTIGANGSKVGLVEAVPHTLIRLLVEQVQDILVRLDI